MLQNVYIFHAFHNEDLGCQIIYRSIQDQSVL